MASKSSLWSRLPQGTLELIFQRLSLVEISRVAGVCQDWMCLTRDMMPRRNRTPCLMYLRGDEDRDDTTTLFDPSSEAHLKFRVPYYFRESITLCARDGWILMGEILDGEDGKVIPFFLNPLTKTRIDLPVIKACLRWGFSFSTVPTSKNCVVVACSIMNYSNVSIDFCRVGEEKWREIEVEHNGGFYGPFCNPVYHNGCFYTVGGEGATGIFNVTCETWTVLSKPQAIDVGPTEVLGFDESTGLNIVTGRMVMYLVESNEDDEILLVVADPLGTDISVYKLMDPLKNEWRKVKRIGGNLYLSRYGSIFTREDDTRSSNKIYFNRFRGQDCVVYSLEEDDHDRLSSSNSACNRSKIFVKTREHILGLWIDLSLSSPSQEQLSWGSILP